MIFFSLFCFLRSSSFSASSRHHRPKPQNNRPNGYGNGQNQGYNQAYGHYPYSYYSNPQQQHEIPPYQEGSYLNPNLPQVSPPGPLPWGQQYLDPTLPQISPLHLDPNLAQISPPGPNPWDQQYLDPTLPQISPLHPDSSPLYDYFIDRTRFDLDDIKANAKRTSLTFWNRISQEMKTLFMHLRLMMLENLPNCSTIIAMPSKKQCKAAKMNNF